MMHNDFFFRVEEHNVSIELSSQGGKVLKLLQRIDRIRIVIRDAQP
jgi:hypothetical protein